jgi:phosphate transport system substrate-binding protein
MKPIFVALCSGVLAWGSISLTGSGSTFIAPIAQKWCNEYQKRHPGIQISYRSVGSGEGISQAIEGVVDFGATDGPMSRLELESYKAQRNSAVIHFLS